MKLKLFVLFSLAFLAFSQADYTDQTGQTWTDASCKSALQGRILSPINATGSVCAPYTSFSIDLTGTVDINAFDDDMGAPSVPLTTQKMSVNGVSYQSTNILIRTKSEHNIVGTRGDLELQILLQNTADTTQIAALAFVIRSATSPGYVQAEAKNSFITMDDNGGSEKITVNLSVLDGIFQNKLDNDLYLNLLTYEGSQTYPTCQAQTWFIYGSEVYIKATEFAKFAAILTALNTNNIPLSASGENSRTPTGNIEVTRLCYTGYFEVYMNENYGLWFGVTIIVLWFIVNLILGDKPIKDENYKENTWTHHPFVSLLTVGNEIFSRKQRMSLLLGTITIHALFSSVWYRESEDRTKGSNIIVFAIYSMLVNWVVTYGLGLILRGYTLAKHQYYKTKADSWDQKAQNRIFAFYFSLFFIIVIGWPFTVWNMAELHPEVDGKASDYWVASFFVGLALEFLLFDPLMCLLAKKIGFIHSWIKGKGYFYDNLTHETYLTYLKWD